MDEEEVAVTTTTPPPPAGTSSPEIIPPTPEKDLTHSSEEEVPFVSSLNIQQPNNESPPPLNATESNSSSSVTPPTTGKETEKQHHSSRHSSHQSRYVSTIGKRRTTKILCCLSFAVFFQKCDKCGKKYTAYSCLTRHIASKHIRVDLGPYCVPCRKYFGNGSEYERHRLSSKHKRNMSEHIQKGVSASGNNRKLPKFTHSRCLPFNTKQTKFNLVSCSGGPRVEKVCNICGIFASVDEAVMDDHQRGCMPPPKPVTMVCLEHNTTFRSDQQVVAHCQRKHREDRFHLECKTCSPDVATIFYGRRVSEHLYYYH